MEQLDLFPISSKFNFNIFPPLSDLVDRGMAVELKSIIEGGVIKLENLIVPLLQPQITGE